MNGDITILSSYRILNQTIEFLKSEEDVKEKERYVIRSYKALFPSKGALSEFYIWDNDFEKRKSLNESFEAIHNELWSIVKDYR